MKTFLLPWMKYEGQILCACFLKIISCERCEGTKFIFLSSLCCVCIKDITSSFKIITKKSKNCNADLMGKHMDNFTLCLGGFGGPPSKNCIS